MSQIHYPKWKRHQVKFYVTHLTWVQKSKPFICHGDLTDICSENQNVCHACHMSKIAACHICHACRGSHGSKNPSLLYVTHVSHMSQGVGWWNRCLGNAQIETTWILIGLLLPISFSLKQVNLCTDMVICDHSRWCLLLISFQFRSVQPKIPPNPFSQPCTFLAIVIFWCWLFTNGITSVPSPWKSVLL